MSFNTARGLTNRRKQRERRRFRSGGWVAAPPVSNVMRLSLRLQRRSFGCRKTARVIWKRADKLTLYSVFSVCSCSTMTGLLLRPWDRIHFVAPPLGSGEARTTEHTRSGLRRSEQRSQSPKAAQPAGPGVFWPTASSLARGGSLGSTASLTPRGWPKSRLAKCILSHGLSSNFQFCWRRFGLWRGATNGP
jgi:hypothetical protein